MYSPNFTDTDVKGFTHAVYPMMPVSPSMPVWLLKLISAINSNACAAISEKRLSLTRDGRMRYELKTPYHKWYHPRYLRTVGLYCQARGVGAETASKSHTVSRCIRSQQQTPY